MYSGEVIKSRRLELGMTLEEVSLESGFSIGYLSKLERGNTVPPLATMQKLAAVLGIDMMELLNVGGIESETKDRDIEISRNISEEETAEQYSSRAIFAEYRNRAVLPLIMHINPGETEVFTHDAEEFIYVLEGEVILEYKDKRHELKKGDGAYIDSRKAHRFINQCDKKALLLTANYIYRRF